MAVSLTLGDKRRVQAACQRLGLAHTTLGVHEAVIAWLDRIEGLAAPAELTGIQVTRDPDGTPDAIEAANAWVRIERLSGGHWLAEIKREGHAVSVEFRARRTVISVTAAEA